MIPIHVHHTHHLAEVTGKDGQDKKDVEVMVNFTAALEREKKLTMQLAEQKVLSNCRGFI